MYSSLQTLVGDWFPILLDAAIKGTAVLLLAGLLLACMRRASAAARHAVCFSATVSVLLLPLASVVLPDWQILPRWYSLEEESAKRPTPSFKALDAEAPRLADSAAPLPVRDVATASKTTNGAIADSGSLHGRTSSESRVLPPGLVSEPVVSSGPTVRPLPMWLAGLWALGTLAVFATIFLSRLSLLLLERRTKRIVDGPWIELLKETAGTLKIRQSVTLLQTDGHSMPMAGGLLRPKIILPADISSWSHQRCRVVMLHELGHIARRDCLTKMIAQAACALYWFNPLVWLAMKWIRIEAEHACDNLVLASGSDACDYADHLLQVASDRQANRLAACSAIAMARSSKLESRLRAILDPHRRRRLTRLGALVLAATVVGTATLIGCTKGATKISVPAGASVQYGNYSTGTKVAVGPPLSNALITKLNGEPDSAEKNVEMDLKTRTYLHVNGMTLQVNGNELLLLDGWGVRTWIIKGIETQLEALMTKAPDKPDAGDEERMEAAKAQEKNRGDPNEGGSTSMAIAPVVVEAEITGGGDGDKYYYYDIKVLKIITNSISADLTAPIKVARENYLAQPDLGNVYVLDLAYYNDAHPEYGLKIVSFKLSIPPGRPTEPDGTRADVSDVDSDARAMSKQEIEAANAQEGILSTDEDIFQYVSCQATLLKYDKEYWWFDNHEFGHDDGVAPLATFKITKPATYSNREVSIIFKSQHLENMLPTLKQGVGKPFLLEVPEDFLKGKANIIEAVDVPTLKRQTLHPNRTAIRYPYVAPPDRQDQIRKGYTRVRLGMKHKEVTAVLGEPDDTKPLYEPQKQSPRRIGSTFWYLIARTSEAGDPDEKLVRVSFDMNDRVTRVDHWGFGGADTSTTALSTDDSQNEAVAERTPAVASSSARRQLTRFEEDHKYGFKNDAGETVIPPKYDDARDFSEGLAAVNIGAEWDLHGYRPGGKWGYIDARGKLIIPVALESAGPFSEGLAQVCDNDGYRYIDATGKTAITVDPAASSSGRFREGVAPVHIDRSLQNKDWLTRFINKRGQVVFEVTGYAEEFSEGFAKISISNPRDKEASLCGFVNHKGEIVIEPEYAEASDFSDGLSAVRPKKTVPYYGMGDAWGYIDRSGRFVLKPQFNEAHPFVQGVARVHIGGEIQETTVHGAPSWEGGEWRLIDKKGNILKRSKDWLDYETTPVSAADETNNTTLSSEELTRLKNIGSGWYKVKARRNDVALVYRALRGDDVKANDWACLAVEKMAGKGLFAKTSAKRVIPLLISQMASTRDDTCEFSMRAIGAMARQTEFLNGEQLSRTLGITLKSIGSDDAEMRRRASGLADDLVRVLNKDKADQLIRAVLAAAKRRGKPHGEADVRARAIALRTLSFIGGRATERKLATEVATELVDSLGSSDEDMRTYIIIGAAALAPKVDDATCGRIVKAAIAAAADRRYIYSITSGRYSPPLHAGANALAIVAPYLDADALQRAERSIPSRKTVKKPAEYESMYGRVLRALVLRRKQLRLVPGGVVARDAAARNDKTALVQQYRKRLHVLSNDKSRKDSSEMFKQAATEAVTVDLVDQEVILAVAASFTPAKRSNTDYVIQGSVNELKKLKRCHRVSNQLRGPDGWTISMYIGPKGNIILVTASLTFY